MVGPPPGARELDGAHGPGRSAAGQGHLEAGGLLPQRQGGQLPVCHSSQRPHQDTSQWRHPVHSQVIATLSYSQYF